MRVCNCKLAKLRGGNVLRVANHTCNREAQGLAHICSSKHRYSLITYATHMREAYKSQRRTASVGTSLSMSYTTLAGRRVLAVAASWGLA